MWLIVTKIEQIRAFTNSNQIITEDIIKNYRLSLRCENNDNNYKIKEDSFILRAIRQAN